MIKRIKTIIWELEAI